MRPPRALLLVTALLAAGCGGDDRALPTGAEQVELDPAKFSATVDNPYWPMAPGTRWVYRNGDQRIEVTVLDETRTVAGIEARVVHDVVTQNGKLVEDTHDWYAQDEDGNLWYLGEETRDAEGSTAGSWEAGVDGAQAGIALPAEPKVGMEYRQEYLAGEAEDAGAILSLDERVEVPAGSYDGVLMTKDWTPLEPKVLEHKFYARGVGPVLVLGISGGTAREELVSFTKPA